MDYKSLEKDMIARLDTAHNPAIAKIRGEFFEAEYDFFRENVIDKDVIVLGSGLGHDAFELIKYNYSVIGFEILGALVRESYRRKNTCLPDANVNFFEFDFLDERKSKGYDSIYDVSILNMGTFGNFDNKQEVLESIIRFAPITHLDFYLPGEENNALRKKMYEEEGYTGVKIKGDMVYNDHGFSSESISKDQFKEIFDQVSKRNPKYSLDLEFNDFYKFAAMATISRK